MKAEDVPGIVADLRGEPLAPEPEGTAMALKGLRHVLFAHADERDLTKLSEYEAVGGYRALRKALGMAGEAIVEELLASGLRGRGGAGLPDGPQGELHPEAGRRRRSRST